ncbi:hypothetical protein [Mesorhizobium sp. M0618]|uniref:hypothetical protein n=1 Tax=unclassified Mesorhizobium TaxID=325217 RepID=UPI00333D37D4
MHWHVAVKMQGLEGSTYSSIRKLPGPLPELREALCSVPPWSGIVRRREHPQTGIASTRCSSPMLPKDKDDVVRPLVLNDGLAVWSDGFELRIGNSIRRIDQGLANSHFGVVALSEPFERLDELRTRRNRRSVCQTGATASTHLA